MLALTGCNNDTLPGGDALTEIRLKSGLEVMSRAYTPKQESQIASGEKVYIWSDEASNGVSHFNAWELTADGNGEFNALPDEEKRYFPKSGDAINLYAIHGNFGGGVEKDVTEFPVQDNPVVHSVETDQTTGGNYEKSDLLYATKHGIEKTKDVIALKFYHMLSKVEIAIRPGDGLTKENLEGATVKIVNTKTQVEFVPAKVGDLSAVNRGEMLSATGTAQDITLPTVSVENGGNEFTSAESYGEVIVVPQELTSGTKFIEVKPEGMAPLYYKLASDFTIKSGKKYTFHITVNLTELEVTSSIENWEDGTTEEGGASFPKPDLSLAKVGDYFMNDGKVCSTITEEQKADCVGIVYYMFKEGESVTVNGTTYTNGLIIGLNELESTQWSMALDLTELAGSIGMNGWDNTQKLVNSYPEYPIVTAYNDLKVLEGVATNKSEWYIPSVKELEDPCFTSAVYTVVNERLDLLEKERIDIYYWSSTENNKFTAYVVCLNDGNKDYGFKEVNYSLRLVSAF